MDVSSSHGLTNPLALLLLLTTPTTTMLLLATPTTTMLSAVGEEPTVISITPPATATTTRTTTALTRTPRSASVVKRLCPCRSVRRVLTWASSSSPVGLKRKCVWYDHTVPSACILFAAVSHLVIIMMMTSFTLRWWWRSSLHAFMVGVTSSSGQLLVGSVISRSKHTDDEMRLCHPNVLHYVNVQCSAVCRPVLSPWTPPVVT